MQITPVSIYLLAGSSRCNIRVWTICPPRRKKDPGLRSLIAEGPASPGGMFLSSIVVPDICPCSAILICRSDVMGISIDRIGAALILLFIAKTGGELLSDGMRVLLDASIDFPTLNKIRRLIHQESAVDEIKSLIGRKRRAVIGLYRLTSP